MAWGRWSKIGAVIAVAALCAPCFAAVASAEGEEDTGGFGAFRLKGTNGFSILVMAGSKPHFKHGEVLVLATKRNASVVYFAPATVTATTIDVDLGSVGEIAIEFEPEGSPERAHASCKRGGALTYQPGAWVGTIDLEGEEGFTSVQRSRAKAIVTPFIE